MMVIKAYYTVYRAVKERVHTDLQRQVDSLQRELERVQRKSSKQETKLDNMKKK